MAKKKVSKAQQKRRDARAAAQKTGMQITPQSFQVTPGTQTPNITFTPAEMASGNIYGTDIGNGLTAYTQGGPIKDPTNLRAQLGLGSTAATTTTGGGGTKTQQKTQNPLRQALKGAGKSLSGQEAMQILKDTGVKQDRLLKTAQKMGLGIQGSLERRVQKGQLATPEERLLANVFDTQRQDMNGGMRGSGIPSVLDPRSQIQKTLASGSVGLQPGQRLTGVTKTGQPILTTKDMLGGTSGGSGGGQRGAGDAATPSTAEISPTATTSDFGMEDLGTDMGISASDQAYMDAIDSLSQGLLDQFSGLNQSPGDLGSIFEGLDLNDPITAEILRKYGVGRNYNIDAIRAALRRPQGRSAYLRSSMGGGTNPFRSALSFAPQLSIA